MINIIVKVKLFFPVSVVPRFPPVVIPATGNQNLLFVF